MPREFKNTAEILEILASGMFEKLVGTLENEFFDAKAEPWDLDLDRGKLDLAKDVSSFANWRGGIIVVGAAPGPADTYERNEVQEIHPLPAAALGQTDRYLHVIRDWIYPVPEGLDPAWYPLTTEPGRRLIGFHIPDQRDELRPFLVAHHITEAGKRIDSVFGLVQRLGATTKTETVRELHTLLKEGRRLDEIHQKLDTIIARGESPSAASRESWMKRLFTKIW